MVDLAAIKFSEGLVEAWLEQEIEKGNPSAPQVLEHFKVFARGFDESRLENLKQANLLTQIKAVLDSQ